MRPVVVFGLLRAGRVPAPSMNENVDGIAGGGERAVAHTNPAHYARWVEVRRQNSLHPFQGAGLDHFQRAGTGFFRKNDDQQ